MDNLQAGIRKKKEFNISKFKVAIHFLNLIFILSNFALNFLGSPSLRYVYLAHVILIFITILIYPLDQILTEIITLLFLEGQGRIIWNYQSWARIIFDALLFLALLKIFISNKKMYEKKVIPKAFVALLSLHFIWYIAEMFNVNNPSMIGVLAATKIYIFPELLFLGLTLVNLDIKRIDFSYALGTFALILILELALNIFQMQERQALVLKLSPYYLKAMGNGIFIGKLYRPFGTAFNPGGFSTFIYLSIGLLYLKPINTKMTVIRYMIIGGSIITLILCQVRSALVKYILILIFIHIGTLLFHRLSSKKVFPYIFILLFLSFNLDTILAKIPSFNDSNIEYAIARATALGDANKLRSSRISSDTLGTVLIQKLSRFPLGLGPGMTGAAGSINTEALAHDPVINSGLVWTHDNLIVALVIEFGYGAIFYIILIGLIPVYFTQELVKLYRNKNEEKFRIILICTSTLIVILIGNWGANALTYNPESFFFWFFAALGFYTLSDQRKLT